MNSLSIEIRGDVAVLRMDVPGDTMNTLKPDFADDFAEAFAHLEGDAAVKAVVFASGKPDSFIAGANVEMLDGVTSALDAKALSEAGQRAMDRIAAFPKPVVAAIHGPCLGGGLEVALACHGRVATTSKKTKLGLPESQLGLLPGAGGTQRLPRLIGTQAALDLMLTGKQVDGKKAKRLGLVDDAVPESVLMDVAIARAEALLAPAKAKPGLPDQDALQEMAFAGNALGRKVLFGQARKALHAKTRGNYPAQDAILDVVRAGLEGGFQAGLEAEAEAFGRLVVSPESAALRSIFFATTAMKKDTGVDDASVTPRPVTKVGMLGAGLMGAGIAYVTTARAKTPVRLKDRDADGVMAGLRYVRKIVDKGVKRLKLTRPEADQLMALTTGTTSYAGFGDCEVVIEAVFEDLVLKQTMVQEIEGIGRPDVIFASNTSSLPIAGIAEASAHPETVIGMHYFSPVEKMPLLEIIVTPKTADWVTATCVALGKKQGKTVIVVKDGPGFYTTRILAPLMNEAAWVLSEGVPIDVIDRAMEDFGFPVGPLKLTDEVGIDVGQKVGGVMSAAFGERMTAPPGFQRLIDDGRKGRKNGKGFYLYGDRPKGPLGNLPKPLAKLAGVAPSKGIDETVYAVLGVQPNNDALSADEIAWRCTLPMVNEAARCFGEGILRSARDGDIGAIFGLGFPPFRGGPFRFVDTVGANEIVRRLRALESLHGTRFAPAPALVELAERDGTFHGPRAATPGVVAAAAPPPAE